MRVSRLLPLALGLLWLAAPLSAQERSTEQRILEILLDRGIIDQATYDEITAEARAATQNQQLADVREQLQALGSPDVTTRGGKPGKLGWTSADGSWSLGFKGRLQVRAEVSRGDGGNRAGDAINVSIPRGRLRFFGQAGGENLSYRLEIDTPTNKAVDASKGSSKKQQKSFALKDAWLRWKLGEGTAVKFGQYKFPFGREVLIASTKINLVNESIASKAFAPAREPGAMVYGTVGEDGLLEYYAGISNGDGQGGGNNSGVAGTPATGLRHGVRLVYNPLGKVKLDGAAFQTVDDGATRVALGASWMRNVDVISDTTAGTTPSSDDATLGLELQLLSGPLSFLAERFDRTLDFGSAGPDKNDDGYNAQVGLFLVPREVEVVLRRSEVDLDGKVSGDTKETTLGLNLYNDAHNSKWGFDISDIQHPNAATKDSLRARAQYQLIF